MNVLTKQIQSSSGRGRLYKSENGGRKQGNAPAKNTGKRYLKKHSKGKFREVYSFPAYMNILFPLLLIFKYFVTGFKEFSKFFEAVSMTYSR